MPIITFRYLALYSFLAIGLFTFGQSPHFKNSTIFKGQKDYIVNQVFQDSKGLLWYATSKGLVLYDGVTYTKYTTEDNLESNIITTIAEDDNNNLWIGHKKGKISILDEAYSIRKYEEIDSLCSEDISQIKFINSERFLIATLGGGLFDVNSTGISIYNLKTGFDDYIYDIEVDSSGKVYLATDVGVLIKTNDGWSKISMEDGLPDNIVKELEFDELGRLWIGMEEMGIAVYNLENRKLETVPDWEFGELNHFIIKEKGELWISTKRMGVVKLIYESKDNFQYKNYLDKHGLIDNRTENIFQDRQGNIWISSKQGVSQFSGNLFETLNIDGGLPSNKVFGFIVDAEDRFWVASEQGLFVMKKSNSGHFMTKKLLIEDEYSDHTFTSLYQSDDSTIWVGTYGHGIYCFNTATLSFRNFNSQGSLTNNNIISINGDENNIWFSTSGAGVNYINKNKDIFEFKSYSKENGLGSDYAYSVFKDSKDRIWFAKDGGGISVIENGVLSDVQGFDSLSNVVYGIVEDGLSNIWFTTANEGLIKYDGTKYHHFTIKDGLITNSFNSIISDNYGNCILSSNEGITVFDIKSNEFSSYREDEGVSYLDPNLNAVFKDKNGIVWFGTNNGVIRYDSDSHNKNLNNVKVYITKKQTLETELTDSSNVLEYNQNHLIFDYLGLWYKSPESIVYRYKIEGHDIDWIYPRKSLTARYSGLPPGEYTFKVQATASKGNWKESGTAEFYFVIKAPLWEKWWFILTIILLTVGVLYIFIKARIRNLQRSENKLKEEVKKRTSEISRQKDELESIKNIIELKNKDIMDSIHYAKRIQSAILPSDKLFKEQLPNSFVFYRPKDVVAGDFYWLEQKNNKILFAAADCTGHGVPGAMVSVVCNNALNRSVREHGLTDPSEILTKTREIVIQEFEKSAEEVNDGMDIAICVLDRNTLKYAGAHNSLWIVRNENTKLIHKTSSDKIKQTKANGFTLYEIRADKQPIGKFVNPKPYSTQTFELQKGDSIYIYTDGYADQFGGSKGKKLKTGAFKQLILSMQDRSMPEQKNIIDKTFDTWKGQLEQIDDVCVIGVKF